MRLTSIISVLSTALLLQACGDDGGGSDIDAGGGNIDAADTDGGGAGNLAFSPTTAQSVQAGATKEYTLSGLNDQVAYRVTLVVAANITVTGAAATFLDNDDNGAADAGASENVALITAVNGGAITGVKTVPDPTDDPAAPTGVRPVGGKITVTITGKGAGEIYPVSYVNGGASTLLELNADGTPKESYGIGGKITVQ